MNFKEVFSLFINSYEVQVIFRIILAVCFGSLIGMEREHAHRPAGLRTHILVCVGSCLVMLTSEYIYNYYHQFSPNMDIARLGAQVISGIGFLGAGTIIRNGSSVKGLTTAASIWAVACIGLATGIGFYLGSTVATIIIFVFLAYSRTFYSTTKESHNILLTIMSEPSKTKEIVEYIEKKFSEDSIVIKNISINQLKEATSEILFQFSSSASFDHTSISSDIYSMPGVTSVSISSKKYIKEEE